MSEQFYQLKQVSLLEVSLKQESVIKKNEKIDTNARFELNASNINEDFFEIIMSFYFNVKNTEEQKEIFQSKVAYSGVFQIRGFDEAEINKIIRTHASAALYPFCRSKVLNLLSETPLKGVEAPMIDFFTIYQSQEEENKKETES